MRHGADRTPGLPAGQIIVKRLDATVGLGRILCQGFGQDRGQISRVVQTMPCREHRRYCRRCGVRPIRIGPGQCPGQNLVRRHRQSIDIIGQRGRGQRTTRRAGIGACHPIQPARRGHILQPGNPKVDQLGPAIGRDQDIAGLYIAMHNLRLMCVGQSCGHLPDQADPLRGCQGRRADRRAVDKVHHQIMQTVRGLAAIKNPGNRLMIHPGQRPAFGVDQRAKVQMTLPCGHELDRHNLCKQPVRPLRAIDRPHPTRANQLLQPVNANLCRRKGQCGARLILGKAGQCTFGPQQRQNPVAQRRIAMGRRRDPARLIGPRLIQCLRQQTQRQPVPLDPLHPPHPLAREVTQLASRAKQNDNAVMPNAVILDGGAIPCAIQFHIAPTETRRSGSARGFRRLVQPQIVKCRGQNRGRHRSGEIVALKQ